jgi:hypothetical protein
MSCGRKEEKRRGGGQGVFSTSMRFTIRSIHVFYKVAAHVTWLNRELEIKVSDFKSADILLPYRGQ